jgi:hypothetical protein
MTNRADYFTRADTASFSSTPSDAGSSWVSISGSGIGISSNKAYAISTSSTDYQYLEANSADVEVSLTVSTYNNPLGAVGIIFRVVDINNLWMAYVYPAVPELRIARWDAGVYSTVDSVAFTPADGDVLKVTCSGSTINVYANTVLKLGPYTNSTHSTATKHGIYLYADPGQGSRLDDFVITDTGAAVSSPGSRLAMLGIG